MRRGFPHFYLFVMAIAALAAGLLVGHDKARAALLALIAVTTLPTRQILKPAINRAMDQGQKSRFRWRQGLPVDITLVHIALAGYALVGCLP
jgi:hypothetical protein